MAGAIAKLFGGGEPSPLVTAAVREAVRKLDEAATKLEHQRAAAATLAASVERLARELAAAEGEIRSLVDARPRRIAANLGTADIDNALRVAQERARIARVDHSAAQRMAHAHGRHGSAHREPGALAAAQGAHQVAVQAVASAVADAARRCKLPITMLRHCYGEQQIGCPGELQLADIAAQCRSEGAE